MGGGPHIKGRPLGSKTWAFLHGAETPSPMASAQDPEDCPESRAGSCQRYRALGNVQPTPPKRQDGFISE